MNQLASTGNAVLQETDDREKARRLGALRYRLARVADLQRQREELDSLARDQRSLGVAAEIAKLDSALRVARLALAEHLQRLPVSERFQFIKLNAHDRPAPTTVLTTESGPLTDTSRREGIESKSQTQQ